MNYDGNLRSLWDEHVFFLREAGAPDCNCYLSLKHSYVFRLQACWIWSVKEPGTLGVHDPTRSFPSCSSRYKNVAPPSSSLPWSHIIPFSGRFKPASPLDPAVHAPVCHPQLGIGCRHVWAGLPLGELQLAEIGMESGRECRALRLCLGSIGFPAAGAGFHAVNLRGSRSGGLSGKYGDCGGADLLQQGVTSAKISGCE